MFPPSPQFGGHSGAGLWNFWIGLRAPAMVSKKAAVRMSLFMSLAYEIELVVRTMHSGCSEKGTVRRSGAGTL